MGWTNQVVQLVVIQGTGPGTGLFVYNGTPGLGNSPIFWATSANVDPYGNVLPSTAGAAAGDFAVKVTSGGRQYLLSMGQQNGFPVFYITDTGSAPNVPPSFGAFNAASAAGCEAIMTSGNSVPASTACLLQLQDSTLSGIAGGFAALTGGIVAFGTTQNCSWDDITQSFFLPATSGPFIQGEGYHSIGLPSGLSGSFRVHLRPDNLVILDARLSWTTTTATTFTLTGNLPSASYYPTSTALFPLTHNGTPTALAAPARVFLAGSGAPQVIVPATSGGASVASCQVIYPNN